MEGYMKSVPGLKLFHGLIYTAVLSTLAASVHGQDMFPEGEGRNIVLVTCAQCHGIDYLPKVKLSSEEWRNAIYDMMARGAVIAEKDLDTVENYLINSFAIDKN
jgi:mono/diheme cytochrome c family protein